MLNLRCIRSSLWQALALAGDKEVQMPRWVILLLQKEILFRKHCASLKIFEVLLTPPKAKRKQPISR